MSNPNGWGDGASNNDIGWGQGADNAIGWGSIYANSWAGATDIVGTPAVDPDAQAFITAASITDPTQQSAINQLVVDLKGYGLWTKIYAAYPIVGGTASSHAVNLKTPGTRNLTFTVGWTHSANGMTPNGAAYADSNFNPVTVGITKTNFGVSAYSRTDIVQNGSLIGLISLAPSYIELRPRRTSNIDVLACYDDTVGSGNYLTNSLGLFTAVRTGTTQKYYQGATEKSQRTAFAATADLNGNIYIGARNYIGFPTDSYSTKQTTWAAFHEFFDATEMNNYNTAVQTFQTTLGRSIGTQTVSDADAQAFVTAANIIDQVQANAINTLVIGLKADGLWTKLKAAYPMVGGTSASHYINLKTPGTYNLSFSTGWTHSATGATPNGAAFADTLFNPSALSQSLTSTHLSYYQRGNSDSGTSRAKIGAATNDTLSDSIGLGFFSGGTREVGIIGATGGAEYAPSGASAAAQGLFMINTNGNRNARHWKNGVANGAAVTQSGAMPNFNIYLAALNNNNFATVGYYHNKEVAWASIGDGFTDTEAANLYTRVQTFQTTLNRQV